MDILAELQQADLPDALKERLLTAMREQACAVVEQSNTVAEQQALLAKCNHALKNQSIKIDLLTLELAHLKRLRFGQKSEAYRHLQPDLFEETKAEDLAAIEAELEEALAAAPATAPARPARPKTSRPPLPEHLERVVHRHDPECCTCGQCGGALTLIREEISEKLEIIPSRFIVHQHIYPQMACRPCETIQANPVPPALIDGGFAGPGLLAWVVTSKFLDHIPLYRQESIAAREGVTLARSTLAGWVGKIGVALSPLSVRLADKLRGAQVLHADETPVAQLSPGQGKTHRSYLWVYRSNDLEGGPPIVVFDYQTGRSGQHARDFLQDWRGHLMVDDYGGYKSLLSEEGMTELACLAHIRRKYVDLYQANQSPIADEAIRRIGELYAIEQRGRDLSADERRQLREWEAIPRLASMQSWLIATRATVAESSGTAKAMDYGLRRWPALERYARSGILPIDNNPCENAIRPVAVGKKNWMFMGSERAGRRAASLLTLLGTARLNGLDPALWLRDTLEKLPSWPNSRLDELLPLRPNADPQAPTLP